MAMRQTASRARKGRRSATVRGDDTLPHEELGPEENLAPRSNRASRPVAGGQNKAKHKRDSAGHVYGAPVPEGLHEAIEIERGNLSKAESLLGCLAISMEYETDSVNGPYYPDVAQIARDLVRQSINGLDSFTLKQYLLRNKIKEETNPLNSGGMCSLEIELVSSEAGARVHRHFSPIEISSYAAAR
jgi:hypothetical protein